MDNDSINDTQLGQLVQALCENKTLEELLLNHNKISGTGIAMLASRFGEMKGLKKISMYSNLFETAAPPPAPTQKEPTAPTPAPIQEEVSDPVKADSSDDEIIEEEVVSDLEEAEDVYDEETYYNSSDDEDSPK
jgi:hypothetical protein